MSRTTVSIVAALVALLGLAPAAPAYAQTMDDRGSGSGDTGGMMSHMSHHMGMGDMMGGRMGMRMGRSAPGCGSGQQNVAASAIAELPSVTISIQDGFYLPAQLTVPAGTRVIWVNQGSQPHTTTSWDRWDSGVLRPGQSCEAWFVTPGTYDYLSIVAADGGTMTGSITVAGSLPEASGASSGTMPREAPMRGPGY